MVSFTAGCQQQLPVSTSALGCRWAAAILVPRRSCSGEARSRRVGMTLGFGTRGLEVGSVWTCKMLVFMFCLVLFQFVSVSLPKAGNAMCLLTVAWMVEFSFRIFRGHSCKPLRDMESWMIHQGNRSLQKWQNRQLSISTVLQDHPGSYIIQVKSSTLPKFCHPGVIKLAYLDLATSTKKQQLHLSPVGRICGRFCRNKDCGHEVRQLPESQLLGTSTLVMKGVRKWKILHLVRWCSQNFPVIKVPPIDTSILHLQLISRFEYTQWLVTTVAGCCGVPAAGHSTGRICDVPHRFEW